MKPAGKHPFAVARLDGAFDENDPSIIVGDDRADGHLRIDVVDKCAARAHEAFGSVAFSNLDSSAPPQRTQNRIVSLNTV
jgi:hypothetical protein